MAEQQKPDAEAITKSFNAMWEEIGCIDDVMFFRVVGDGLIENIPPEEIYL